MRELERLATLADAPEILKYLESCSEGTLNHVKRCLQSVVAVAGHPSAAYRSRIRVGLMSEVWGCIWAYDSGSYLKELILNRIVFSACRYTPNTESTQRALFILANLWDKSNSGEDVDEDCEAVEDWNYIYLYEHYSHIWPSLEALENTAGRALYFLRAGSMAGTVSAQEAIDYFGLGL